MKFFRRNGAEQKRPLTQQAVKSREYYYLGEGIALAKLKSGHFVYVDPLEESVCSHLIAHGEWEPWISKVVTALVQVGDHVVEVGGHVGYYTLGMAQKVGPTGSVLTFEANPRLAALAQRSVRFNGFGKIVKIEQKVASDTAGTLKFMVSRQFAGGSHVFLRDGLLSKDAEVIEVESVRLDDLRLKKVDFLRIDAEGSEVLILQGAQKVLANPDLIICMEWDLVQMRSRSDPDELLASLVEQGFKFWQIQTDSTLMPLTREALMRVTSCDVVITRRDEATLLSRIASVRS